MAKARFYALNDRASSKEGRKYFAGLKGQAKIVADVMAKDLTPKLASDISEFCKEIKTRQDLLRVVLYYIIIFKGKGFVSSFDELPEDNSVENAMAEILSELRDEDTVN